LFTAKNEFRKLFIKSTQSFHEFHTKFLQLASKAKVASAELKYELNSKLSFSLQKAVISHFNTESTFHEFAKQYTIYDQSLKAIEERESRVRKPCTDANKTNTPTATAPATTITTTLPTTPRTNTFQNTLPKPTYQNPLRQQLSNAGKCFICRESGHRINDCPKRTDIKAIEQSKEVLELSENDDP
jgi:hypothetical protein